MNTLKILTTVISTTFLVTCAITGAAVIGLGLGGYVWLAAHGFIEAFR